MMYRALFPKLLLLVVSSLLAASCAQRRHVQARTFVPPQRKPFALPPAPQLPDPPTLEAKSDAENPPEIPFDIFYPPPPPPPQVRRPPTVAQPKPAPPIVVETPPSPRLGQIFTADQLREYNRAFDDSLARVRTILAVAAGRKLTAQQAGIVARIRTFLMQAEQARQQDLVTAMGLARRADLLAQDLSASLP
jgi:hypothetical protein